MWTPILMPSLTFSPTRRCSTNGSQYDPGLQFYRQYGSSSVFCHLTMCIDVCFFSPNLHRFPTISFGASNEGHPTQGTWQDSGAKSSEPVQVDRFGRSGRPR